VYGVVQEELFVCLFIYCLTALQNYSGLSVLRYILYHYDALHLCYDNFRNTVIIRYVIVCNAAVMFLYAQFNTAILQQLTVEQLVEPK